MFRRPVPCAAEVLRWSAFVSCLAGIVGLSSFLVSCSSFEHTLVTPPEIPGATFVGNAACADCHKDYTRLFAGSAHSRVHLEAAAMKGQSGCESCHGPGSKHVALPSAKGSIFNSRKDSSACLQCHLQTHAEFNLPQHHPLPEGKMNCLQCHDPHGFDIRQPARAFAMARVNAGCADCHREQSKPVVYEHEAMREGCTTCHQPHGSVNQKMLTQSDNNLCLRCHAQNQNGSSVAPRELYIGKVNHTDMLRLGTCWNAGCHTAVHGSNVNRRMFY